MLMELVKRHTKRLRYILQHKYLFKIFCLFTVLFALVKTNFITSKSIYNISDTEFYGKVYKLKITEEKTTIYILGKEKLVVNYYDTLQENISLGDKIYVVGNLKEPSNNTIPNLFNYKKYLSYNGIYYTLTASSIKKISNNTNIIYYLKEKIANHIDNITNANEYISIFILGDSSLLDEKILESFRENGISHLFSISGMHISLFASIIFYFVKRISYNNYYNYGVVITFLLFYAILIGSSPSVIRSITMYIIFSFNKLFNLKIKKLDIMLIVLIIMLIINPFYLYNISFQYSYLISFFLVLYSKKISTINNKILKSFYTSLISFLISLPICLYNFYQVNFLSIILNIIFIPFVSIIIFPLSLISLIIPKLSIILKIATNLLQNISLIISKYHLGIVNFSKPHFLLIIIYYLFIILFLNNKKHIYIFFIILLHKYNIYLNPYTKITYLDVGQGDSIFIKYPYNKGNILIDTGGLINSSYSIAIDKIIPYLKSIGINQIDYLILTHGDYDHLGEAINLVENFKVKKIIFNCGDFNESEQNLKKILDKKEIPYYSCPKELNISNNKLYFLNNNNYKNENDSSIIIYTKINNFKFLFMGDASSKVEDSLIAKYNLQDIDFIKIAHHGSNTSSSKFFIDTINPQNCIISVGKNNWYHHPSNEVLNTLYNYCTIHRTDINGSIEINIKDNNYQIYNYKP